MTVIDEAIEKLLKLKIMIGKIIEAEALQHREFISNLNRKQLKDGQKADSSDMPNYVGNSRQPSAPGKITLFDTGDFHEGIEPLIDDIGWEMVGLDEKTTILVSKYGDILGLTEESKKLLREKLLPGIIIRINQIL